jgi:quercetin dioxygenase-like cupin family protein
VSYFGDLSKLERLRIWDGLVGRAVVGAEASLVAIEIEPDTDVPQHQHPNEQTGILIQGSLTFTIGGEVRELRPGATWVIPGNVPHSVRSGAEGAALIELFAPPRDDWGGLERLEPAPTASFGVAE